MPTASALWTVQRFGAAHKAAGLDMNHVEWKMLSSLCRCGRKGYAKIDCVT